MYRYNTVQCDRWIGGQSSVVQWKKEQNTMNDEQHELVEYTNVKHTSLNFDNFILPIHGRLNMNFMSKHVKR